MKNWKVTLDLLKSFVFHSWNKNVCHSIVFSNCRFAEVIDTANNPSKFESFKMCVTATRSLILLINSQLDPESRYEVLNPNYQTAPTNSAVAIPCTKHAISVKTFTLINLCYSTNIFIPLKPEQVMAVRHQVWEYMKWF